MLNFKPSETCLRLAESFSLVVDGEADPSLLKEALLHMKTCPNCEGEFSRFKDLVEYCRASKLPAPSIECRNRLIDLFKKYQTQQGER